MRTAALVTIVCMMIPAGIVSAQPPSGSEPTPNTQPTPVDEDADARAHYDKGRALVEQGKYDEALAEFSEARRTWPDRWAPASASAVCLKNIGRFDEAADIMTAILRDHAERLPEETKTAIQKEIIELNSRVGTLQLTEAEPGARITIDGLPRGEYPFAAAPRVVAGSHLIGLYKDGFLPLEIRIEVAGGHSSPVAAKMVKLVQAGTLVVDAKKDDAKEGNAKEGNVFDVVVDGLIVGQTPWKGPIAAGIHTVMLRGPSDLGSLPKAISIRPNATASMTLSVEQLAASLTIKPLPVEASVAIDGIFVARGGFQGRVRPGAHTVLLVADGYFSEERKLDLERGKDVSLSVPLRRDPNAIRWREPGRFGLEAAAGIALSPSLGGDVGGCDAPCTTGLGLGGQFVVHGGYEVWNGFGFGVSVGYLRVDQTNKRPSVILSPIGLDEISGAVTDTLRLRGFRGGIWASYRVGQDRLRGRLRVGAGALFSTVTDVREGDFPITGTTLTTNPALSFHTGPVIEAPYATWFYVAPEAKLVLRVVGRLEISAGLEGLVLVSPTQPTWDEATPIYAANRGNANFGADTLVGSTVIVFVPNVSARYDF